MICRNPRGPRTGGGWLSEPQNGEGDRLGPGQLCEAAAHGELARLTRMGVSTLHHQFRALTAMSPLQYQKQLRLQAARHRMLMDGIDATRAAYEVGYESISQFSREYSRFFGQPPCGISRLCEAARWRRAPPLSTRFRKYHQINRGVGFPGLPGARSAPAALGRPGGLPY